MKKEEIRMLNQLVRTQSELNVKLVEAYSKKKKKDVEKIRKSMIKVGGQIKKITNG